ncbi:Exodeoxyribonuclease 7 large subunit [Fundidesulfovibrio magnetotacticus]|uniref:Exodeoxyribonuclease 7 large subunit n=1 Tax=Fundidesulfovibrio magnetotacticus TaxID=2730080 RepID=A0A6V8LZW2_9BACT|nr:exodeoxyribonuclease VII large subunit [Fundidesulfovibrio magnetotacticus]GFK95559.1 Exodeoxyribonuclease 7 large subunit [Fundidesulfovibrio magnetotacticus]
MPHIFRVGEITRALKDVVEGQFPFVWVRGQVSNLARPASGHVYFSLKDEESVLSVVWFKGSRLGLPLEGRERYDPLTGEVLEEADPSAWLSEGVEALCAGRLTVYAPRGSYQLVAELVQDMGLGRLHLEFEALKRRLAQLGWFDQERKRPLPRDPVRVALVTSASGAAVKDFLRVGGSRGLGCEVRLHPCLVQGEQAPGQIARALEAAGADGWAEAVALVRGGGSLEDLWAFNTEEVARAVVECPVPVVCGVGHEVDVTIADMAADVRAATPSHAAQLLWSERPVLAQRADEALEALERGFARFLAGRAECLEGLARALSWLSPRSRVERLGERLEDLSTRLARAGQDLTRRGADGLEALARRLDACGPSLGDTRALDALESRLELAAGLHAERAGARLELLTARLEGLDPLGPLARGYALALKADGTALRSVTEASPGDRLDIVARDGRLRTSVLDVEETR